MTPKDVFTVGMAVIFLWTLFVSIYYSFLTHSNPTHAVYQFPITAKERVRNHYISPIFMFVTVSLALVLFGYIIAGLFALLGNIEGASETDPFYLEGTIFSVGYLLLVYSIYMPTSFMLDKKKRFIVGIVGLVFLILISFSVVLLASGSFTLSLGIAVILLNSSRGLLVSIITLIISLIAAFGSYKFSGKLLKYD
jgi:hypothetical protein